MEKEVENGIPSDSALALVEGYGKNMKAACIYKIRKEIGMQ